MIIKRNAAVIFLSFLFATSVAAQTPSAETSKAQLEKLRETQLAAAKQRKADADAEVKSLETGDPVNDFRANFGLGAAVFFYKTPHIDTAELIGTDRRVTVTKKRSHQVSPWLQANYVWDLKGSKTMSPGIFAGLGMGADNSFLDTFGLGGQIAFKRVIAKSSMNLGVGYYWSSIQELADGIVEGQPLPVGIDQIKYKNRSAHGVMLNLSFGFQ